MKYRRNFFKLLLSIIIPTLYFKKVKSDLVISDFEKKAGFRSYGLPSKFERIFRWITSNPNYSGNGVSYSPLSKLAGSITPNGLHFERHHYGVPVKNPNEYNLQIESLDGKRVKYSIDILREYNLKTIKTFIECGGNSNVLYNKNPVKTSVDYIHGLFSISEWTGIPLEIFLSKLITDYQKKKNIWIEFSSFDKGTYNISLPIKVVKKNSLLALYQNGEPIRPEQGYPLRLIIPGWEGSTHVKWLNKIRFRYGPAYTRNETSRYTDLLTSGKSRQYSFLMGLKSIITSPTFGSIVKQGQVLISGLAWSGSSLIKKVEVSTDGGISWQNAKINASKKTFVRFNYNFKWNGNAVIIQSRCIDNKNKIQPLRKDVIKRLGKNAYYHFNGITSWKIKKNGQVVHVYN